MPYVVGSEIKGYCTKCKDDTKHTVKELVKDSVRKVTCSECEHVHVYRQPRKSGKAKTRRRRKKSEKVKDPWAKAMEGREEEEARDYVFSENYEEGDLIEHEKFGRGVIMQNIGSTKMQVVFKDGMKLMVCNRDI